MVYYCFDNMNIFIAEVDIHKNVLYQTKIWPINKPIKTNSQKLVSIRFYGSMQHMYFNLYQFG